MKKVIFILALAVSAGSLMAQTEKKEESKPKPNKERTERKALTPEEKASKISNRLKTTLSLTDDQTTKVSAITVSRVTSMRAAREKSKDDKAAFGAERKKIMATWESDLKGILSAEQYTQYNKLKEERKAAMKEKRANNKGTAKPTDSEEDEDDIDE